MNQSTAVTISWILVVVLILAVVAALYAAYYAAQQRTRAEAAAAELSSREDELEYFVTTTMPFAAESARRSEGQPELPTGNDRFPRLLRGLAERYIGDLHLVQAETRDRARHEADFDAQQAISRAEAASRTEVEAAHAEIAAVHAEIAAAHAEVEAARAEVEATHADMEVARAEVETARGEAARVRAEEQASSHEATSAAVRSFGTSVVSLGADVGQVVSDGLRRHRGDEVYETLSRIDHNVQQMIRQAQSYVIVCGGLPGRRWPQQSLTDIIGGAVGRVRDYTRVRSGQLDRTVISRAVEPLVHTLATLLDNALRYSPPTSFVDIGFQEGHHGVTIIIDDAGVRMNAEQMEEARQILASERAIDIHQLGPAPRVGLPGIAALARRYGFSVYVDGPNAYGGMRAMVFVPETLLTERIVADNVAPAVSAPEPVPTQPNPPVPTSVPAPTPIPEREPEPEPVTTSTVHEITPGGLPRRRRRTISVSSVARLTGPSGTITTTSDDSAPRPEIATAWHSGSQSGRAAFDEHTEGMTS